MTQNSNGSIFAIAIAVPCGAVAAAIAFWAISFGGFLSLVTGAVVAGIVWWLLARDDAPMARPSSEAQTGPASSDPQPGAAAASPSSAAVAPSQPEPEPAPEPDPVPDPTPMPKPDAEAVASAGAAADTDSGADSGSDTGEAAKPDMLSAPKEGGADDLKQIKGVGPKLEQLLNSMGVYHFDQIAGWTAEEIAWVDENLQGFKGRVSRDDWVAQARTLARGEATEFSDKVKKGDVY
jgi:predicted flap endonuclease-1-like 5' DNA nuclease